METLVLPLKLRIVTRVNEEMLRNVELLKTVAKTTQVTTKEIRKAFKTLEKANLDRSNYSSIIGGTKSPGRPWMLVYTVSGAVLMPSEEDSILWGYTLNLDLAEFDCKEASGSGQHVEIIQRRARCLKYAPLELYFWLYLHHHIRGNYKCSLRWLQVAKKLKGEDRPDQEWLQSSPDNYFCCEYTLLRCEADLWMKLQATEEAIRTLKDMLTSRQCHVHQGSERVAREAKQWLHKCQGQPSAVEIDEHGQ
ncbi:hypothetical protein R1sor_001043 [Riccia sorocarpa]|uniref:Uncharacterized protein n=1 Tax=Riccia sorocarpa TaxID=122646 RepID=A0ABD3GZ18_9MARC